MNVCEICGQPVLKGQRVCEECVDKVGATDQDTGFSIQDFEREE